MTRHMYEIRVIGSVADYHPFTAALARRIGGRCVPVMSGTIDLACGHFSAHLVVEVEPAITVLSGNLDQRGLHAVLDRVRALGLELVEITQVPPSSRCRSGGTAR